MGTEIVGQRADPELNRQGEGNVFHGKGSVERLICLEMKLQAKAFSATASSGSQI